MPKKYYDRGIIKWAPFDALNSRKSIQENLDWKLNKQTQMELSPDQYDQLNKIINQSYQDKLPVLITYYKDGYYYQISGRITKLDYTFMEITINDFFLIKSTDITDITIL